jgi:hypothetical protein
MALSLIKHRDFFFLLYLDQRLPNSFSLRLPLYAKRVHTTQPIKIFSRVAVTTDGVLHWILDILTIMHHLCTQLGTTSKYSAITNRHVLQITRAQAKSFPASCVFTNRSLVTASKSGDSSTSAFQSFLHTLPRRTE